MIKRVLSLLIGVMLIVANCNSLFAHSDGQYITEERITQEYKAAIEEVADIVFEKTKVKIPKGFTEVTIIEDDGKTFITTVKAVRYEKQFTGTFEDIEGVQEFEFKLPLNQKLKISFEGKKEVIIEAVPEVKEIKTLFYIGYEYHGKAKAKVIFNEDLSLTNEKELNKKKPFKVGKSKIWTVEKGKKVYLYKACDWIKVTEPEPEPGTIEGPENETIEGPENETIEVEDLVVDDSLTEAKEDEIKTNTKNLPQTGEEAPNKIIIVGVLLTITGLLVVALTKCKKTKIKRVK
jgi:LPXTG-motif cell wall-anchored protein